MTEWRLFDEATVPEFTTTEFFTRHPWVPPEHQAGHAERTAMVVTLVEQVQTERPRTWSDIGCGDGALLSRAGSTGERRWGYDAGTVNVMKATTAGLDVRHADRNQGDIGTAHTLPRLHDGRCLG